jgi:alkylation response protein AidB-like acyl-CoA dehydrogenase
VELDTSKELKEFREEARTWLSENVPSEARPHTVGPELREYDQEWQRRQYEGGWAGIDWEPEYGGRGLSLVEQVVWYEELVRARAPRDSVFSVAFGHAGPTLIMRGNEEQKSFYLPKILRGETPWSQGFSEPGAGSDLASLRTRAVVDGDELVISGSKIWTSYGQWSDYGELLVRTDPDAPKHKGITWVIMDMHAPGVDIRPITSIDGFPHNCEVFYDEARIPLANVVDKVNNGWSVAMSTLAAERGPGFLDHRLSEIVFIDELTEYAKEHGKLADQSIADRLATVRAEAAAIRSMAYYQVSTARKGEMPGSETTAIRSWLVGVQTRAAGLALDILGVEALEWKPWTRQWLSSFSAPIAGGTTDIQRNIIGERVLGLPR